MINYCRLEPKQDDIIDEKDYNNWDFIYSQYIDIYGLNVKYKNYLKKALKLAKLQNKYVLTKKKVILGLIEIVERELESYKSELNTGGVSLDTSLIHLGKWYGKVLNKKEITAKFYFDLKIEYDKFIQENKRLK